MQSIIIIIHAWEIPGFPPLQVNHHSHACVTACTVFWNWDVTLFLADLIRQVETERTYLEQQSGDRRRLTEYIRRCHLHRAVRSSLSSSFITIHVIYYCSLTNVNNNNNKIISSCFLAETKPCLSEWGAVALVSVVAGTLVRCMHACTQLCSITPSLYNDSSDLRSVPTELLLCTCLLRWCNTLYSESKISPILASHTLCWLNAGRLFYSYFFIYFF